VVPNTPAAPAAVVVTPWYRTTTAIALGSFALGTVAGALIFRRK
jgi:hypothetical protein